VGQIEALSNRGAYWEIPTQQGRHSLIKATLLLVLSLGILPQLGWSAQAEPDQQRGVNERLNEALRPEGGVQVYQDANGNVGTVLDLPGGERQLTVQPPQSPSINLGPPLQLHQRPFLAQPSVNPAPPPAPEFPQKAH
jgi:hypothetical protein